MKVIAVDAGATKDAVVAIVDEVTASPPAGWTPIFFTSPSELIRRLRGIEADSIEKLEIVSEGSPVHLDSLDYQETTNDTDAVEFGEKLRTVPGFSNKSIVYLSGCNTGCAFPGLPRDSFIAQNVANAAGCRVRGARGYLLGYHAKGNEECFTDVSGDNAEVFDFAVNRAGAQCWSTFKPK